MLCMRAVQAGEPYLLGAPMSTKISHVLHLLTCAYSEDLEQPVYLPIIICSGGFFNIKVLALISIYALIQAGQFQFIHYTQVK